MITLQEIKNEVAKEYVSKKDIGIDPFDYIDEIAKRYATECCKASLEKASRIAKISYHACGESQNCGCGGNCDYPMRSVDKQSITNPENITLL